MTQLLAVEQLGQTVVMHVAHGYEILLTLVLHHCRQQVVNLTRGTEEHLTLAILYVLLDIQRNRFCDTEILHVLGNGDTQLLSQCEKVVDGVTRSEHDGCVVQDVNLLRTEFLGSNTLHLDKRTEHQFYVKPLCYVIIGRLLARRFWLGYQNLLYHLFVLKINFQTFCHIVQRSPKSKQRYYFEGTKVQNNLQFNDISAEKDDITLKKCHNFN